MKTAANGRRSMPDNPGKLQCAKLSLPAPAPRKTRESPSRVTEAGWGCFKFTTGRTTAGPQLLFRLGGDGRCRSADRRSLLHCLLNRICGRLRLLLVAAHAFLEFAYTLAETLHDLGNLSPAEQHQYHNGDDEQVNGTIPHNDTYLSCARARLGGALPASLPRGYSITRSSPARRVTCSRSRYSRRGMAYFRLMPARSLNAVMGSLSPRSLR